MARLPRLALAGHAHLAALHGAQGQPLFVDDTDRRAFLAALAQAMDEQPAALHAYALLDGQVPLLLTPGSGDALSRLIQAVGRRYVAGFNRRHGRRGGLWEGRYRAAVVQPGNSTLDAMVYIDLLAQHQHGAAAGEAAWSSAPHHAGRTRDPLLTDSPAYWQLGNTPFDREQAYRRRLADGLPPARTTELAQASHKGWAIGDADFLALLAAITDRPLTPRPRGRPTKSRVDA